MTPRRTMLTLMLMLIVVLPAAGCAISFFPDADPLEPGPDPATG